MILAESGQQSHGKLVQTNPAADILLCLQQVKFLMRSGWGKKPHIKSYYLIIALYFLKVEMECRVKSILNMSERKKVSVPQTGGHMNNLDIIRVQMTV